MRYYIDDSGHYLGGTEDTPLSSNKVPFPPGDARQVWNGSNYNPISITEIEKEKDSQVESELGGDNIRILVSAFKQIITDGTIATKTPEEIIAQAKASRKAEL